jgi:hypothetical protein
MKHWTKITGKWKRWVRLPLLLPVLMLAWLPGLWGQCNLVCNGALNAPLQVAVDQSCSVTLIPDAILEAPQICPGAKNLIVRTTGASSTIVAQGVDLLTFDASAYIGQVLSVTVTHIASTSFCVGHIRVVDNLPPVFNCAPIVASCFVDTDPDVIGYPNVSDNCDSQVALTYVDAVVQDTCVSDTAAIISRTWQAVDNVGNVSLCVQQIILERPSLDSIDFPRDTLLACTNPPLSPDSLGRPKLDSFNIRVDEICDWIMTYEDDSVAVCGTMGYNVLRTWRVIDDCTNHERSRVQIIHVRDTVPPQLICPANMTVNALPGQCYAGVLLPLPQVADNCDNNFGISISTSYGAQGMGPHPFVPLGQHIIQYVASDVCGNSSICTITLTVVDSQVPSAVCDDQVIVALPSSGIGSVQAVNLDEGSIDNCPNQMYYKAKRQSAGACNNLNGDDAPNTAGYQEWFDDSVKFCCDDVGSLQIPVIMRVYEINPGPGAVNPAREQTGGDLYGHYSECVMTVSVQDNLPPVFTSFPDNNISVSCSSNYTNTAAYGTPHLGENCSAVLDTVTQININACGQGTITRTFTATDASGLSTTWTQTIHVVNDQVLTSNQIIWPQNYTSYQCATAISPDDLPDGYDYPVLPQGVCGDLTYSYHDQVFTVAQPACFKILREWTVLDMCHFNPDNPNAGGRYTRTQIIDVYDNQPPVINCPPTLEVATNANCNGAQVTIPNVTGTDCSNTITITNDSPYANNHGANASGFYPNGVHQVTFNATDNCGNNSSCTTTIRVEDKTPPSPICIVGLSVNLVYSDGENKAVVNAEAFNGGSADNCTSNADLKHFIRRAGSNLLTPPSTNTLKFDCYDLGNQLIEYWVTDLAGNSDYCLTYVLIQDNNQICFTPAASGMIAGGIFTENGNDVESVSVQVMGNSSLSMVTGPDGGFEFHDIPLNSSYSLMPQRNDDPLNGVSTIDLVLITKHILGTQSLNSPYKIIAADIDKSGTVATSDLIKLRRLILYLDSQLPNGNKSWRFIPADYVFPDPGNPFAGYFPEVMNIDDLNDDEIHADFIAIKVGDVNGSATPTNLQDIEDRGDQGIFTLIADNRRVSAGETFTVDCYAHGMHYIPGYQFTLGFDTDLLEWEGVEPGELEGVSEGNFGLSAVDEGLITTSWNEETPREGSEKITLFRLSFRAKQDLEVQNALFLSDKMTKAEAYTRTYDVLGVNLVFASAGVSNANSPKGYELFQNRPNPFADETIIAFQMEERGSARLTVYDATGKMIYQQEAVFETGYNEVSIGKSDLPVSGVLYYQLEAGAWKDTKKMIMLD